MLSEREDSSSETSRPTISDRGPTTFASVGLSLLTLLVYAQVGGFEFVNLDDGIFVTELPEVTTGLTADNVAWAFGIHGPGQWHPLAYVSHQAAFDWFGPGPRAHHLINVGFHVASAVFLLLVLKRMTGRLWPSALVATLFALHPLHVASVAWVAERRDVMCAFFWLVTLWVYVSYAQRGGLFRYLLVAVCFALALMSKPIAVTLPCVLLLLDIWPLRRWKIETLSVDALVNEAVASCPMRSWKFLILEKVPLLLMAAASSVLTILSHSGAVISLSELPLHVRFLNALAAYAIYLRKLVWPSDLACWYPHSALQTGFSLSTLAWRAVGGAVVLLLITALVVWQRRQRPYLLVGWCWYLGVLVPVSGLFQTGTQAYLDHFTYLPMIGIYIAVVWAGAEAFAQVRWFRSAAYVALPALLIALLIVTSKQIGTWRNSKVLFEHALRVTEDNALAECNLVNYMMENAFVGEETLVEAKEHIERALKIAPDRAPVQSNAGAVYFRMGDQELAVQHFRRAIELNSTDPKTYFNLGSLLAEQGHAADAIEMFQAALKLDPDFFDAMTNLGVVYLKERRVPEAVEVFNSAIALRPNDSTPYNSLGVVAKEGGDLKKAEEHFRRAIACDASSSSAHCNLADVLLRTNRVDEAIAEYFDAARYKDDFPDAYCSLGTAFLMKNEHDNAARYLNRAIQLNPNLGEAHNNLGVLLENQGKLLEARSHYSEALRINPQNRGARDNLARVSDAQRRQGF